jgi:hypothetical protein
MFVQRLRLVHGHDAAAAFRDQHLTHNARINLESHTFRRSTDGDCRREYSLSQSAKDICAELVERTSPVGGLF